ncbi:hypothetical protein ACFOD4_06115 [Pseudoroseomonas globiformis]|uniref:Aminoglycoside phosphotransferase domain-containing protein n=1 Tax=Teichococcus globiformis TaxID=2307229 RepID=A0ABV7FYE4_9PROT
MAEERGNSQEYMATGAGFLAELPLAELSAAEAEAMAARHFGFHGRATRLAGGRYLAFHLATEDGRGFVLQVLHPAEEPGLAHFQTVTLLNLARAHPELPVPRLHRPLCGRGAEATAGIGGQSCRLRLLDHLPGRPMHLTAPCHRQRRAVGTMLAQLDRGLAEQADGADPKPSGLPVRRMAGLWKLITSLPQIGDRGLAAGLLERFERNLAPRLLRLPVQPVHLELIRRNLRVSEDDHAAIIGITGFEALAYAPSVDALARACADQLQPEGHPLAGPGDVVEAFHALRPLRPEELDLLAGLIAAHVVMVTIQHAWTLSRRRAEAPDVRHDYAHALSGLRRLGVLPQDEAETYLRRRIAAART